MLVPPQITAEARVAELWDLTLRESHGGRWSLLFSQLAHFLLQLSLLLQT